MGNHFSRLHVFQSLLVPWPTCAARNCPFPNSASFAPVALEDETRSLQRVREQSSGRTKRFVGVNVRCVSHTLSHKPSHIHRMSQEMLELHYTKERWDCLTVCSVLKTISGSRERHATLSVVQSLSLHTPHVHSVNRVQNTREAESPAHACALRKTKATETMPGVSTTSMDTRPISYPFRLFLYVVSA